MSSVPRLFGFVGLMLLMFSASALRAADDTPDVKALVIQLDDKDEFVRLKAAKQLGKAGAAAKEAVPALTKLLNDPDYDVRSVASLALERIKMAGDREKADGDSKKKLDDVQKKLDDLQKKFDDLKKKTDATDKDKADLQKKVTASQKAQDTIAQRDMHIADLQTRSTAARAASDREIAALKKTINDLNARLKAKK